MNAINLIPRHRVVRAARRRWLVAWATVALASLGLASGLGAAVSATDPLESRSLEQRLAANSSVLDGLRAQAARDREEAKKIASAIAARRSVGRHPDFSRLLFSLAQQEGDVLLESIDIDRRDVAASGKLGPIRRYVFTIAGVAPRQTVASDFIAGLEGWKVFDRVSLLGSQARQVRGVNAIAFRVEAFIDEAAAPGGGTR